MSSGTIGTIGDFLEIGYGLIVHCENCSRHKTRYLKIDLAAMAERFGCDHDLYVDHFGPRRPLPYYCGECGSRKIGWIVTVRNTPERRAYRSYASGQTCCGAACCGSWLLGRRKMRSPRELTRRFFTQ